MSLSTSPDGVELIGAAAQTSSTFRSKASTCRREQPDADLVALDRALGDLATHDARKAQVVELRFFGGLSMEDIAKTLDVSLRTVHNDWAFARAWLYRVLAGEGESK